MLRREGGEGNSNRGGRNRPLAEGSKGGLGVGVRGEQFFQIFKKAPSRGQL